MANSKIQQIEETAKGLVSMSANGLYNYAPIDYFTKEVFKTGVNRRNFAYYYKYVRRVTDAKTFFIHQLKDFDIYVWCDSVLHTMSKAFPEIDKDTLRQWIEENKEERHILCGTWWKPSYLGY